MSGLPPSEFNYPSAGQQSSIPTSDSRLLDAAETLVTLQSRGGGRGRHSGKEITYKLFFENTPQDLNSAKWLTIIN